MTEAENVKHLRFCDSNMVIWQSYHGINMVDFGRASPFLGSWVTTYITGILICGGHVVLTPSPILPCECLEEGEVESRQWPFPLTRAPEKCGHITRCLHTLDLSLPARASEGHDHPADRRSSTAVRGLACTASTCHEPSTCARMWTPPSLWHSSLAKANVLPVIRLQEEIQAGLLRWIFLYGFLFKKPRGFFLFLITKSLSIGQVAQWKVSVPPL